MELTRADIALILESLNYAKKAFEDYAYYPSYEFKRHRLTEVHVLADKLRTMKKETAWSFTK